MKRRLLLVVVLGAAASLAQALSPIYVSPDVPTGILPGGPTLLPWEIYRYDAAGPSYTTVLTLPGNPTLDGIHKMDALGDWLLSFDQPTNLGGALGPTGEPRDVIRYDGALYSFFFCPSQDPALSIPPGVNLDALYLTGGDKGPLVVSFDVPIELPPGSGTTYMPRDLVQFNRIAGGPGCGSLAWALGVSPFIGVIPQAGVNLIGADSAPRTVFTMSIPATLTPSIPPDPTPPAFTRDEVVQWAGGTYALFEPLLGWPPGSEVDGLSCLANPGVVPITLTVARAVAPPTDIVISWTPSCSEGAEDYGIYEGTLPSPTGSPWYTHTLKDCSSAAPPPLLSEQVSPPALPGRNYYLVVPLNVKAEGSYGLCRPGPPALAAGCAAGTFERPLGTAVCVTPRVLTPCP